MNEDLEFPRNVYKSADNFVSVADQTEFDAAIAAGYFATVPEALGEVVAPAAPALIEPGSKGKKVWGGK